MEVGVPDAKKQIINKPELDTTNIFFMEFVEDTEVRMPFFNEKGERGELKGLKPFTIYDSESKLLARYNEESKSCPIDCLEGKEGHTVVAVSAPSRDIDDFHWVIWKIDQVLDDGHVSLIGPAIADEEDSGKIEEVYPGLLQRVKEYSEDDLYKKLRKSLKDSKENGN